jgi:hypothetical protein
MNRIRRFFSRIRPVLKRLVTQKFSRVPPHKKNALPKSHSFKETDSWKYYDSITEHQPHLVLLDRKKQPRFTLRFTMRRKEEREELVILSIQRERSKGNPSEYDPRVLLPKAKLETEASKKLQAELGMHPSEFLLSEFIYRNRKQIRKGIPVFLRVKGDTAKIYKPLVERFFKKKPLTTKKIGRLQGNTLEEYELNPSKRRVQELLMEP